MQTLVISRPVRKKKLTDRDYETMARRLNESVLNVKQHGFQLLDLPQLPLDADAEKKKDEVAFEKELQQLAAALSRPAESRIAQQVDFGDVAAPEDNFDYLDWDELAQV